MRASKWIALLAVALWASAVLVHAVHFAVPSLWLSQSKGYRILQALDAAPGRCRIILVGSSPVVFGLSANILQKATGCATVNVGQIAVGHALNLYLESVLSRVRPGDWVVLADRQWEQRLDRRETCEYGWSLVCITKFLRMTPHLSEDLGRFDGFGFHRTRQGDLVEYPGMAPRLGTDQKVDVDETTCRLRRVEHQVQAIRAAGARPLLAPVPFLVPEYARPQVERQLAMLSAQVRKSVGAEIWLTPSVYSEAGLFTGDGEHLSEAGRRRWTAEVLQAIPAQL